MTEEIVSLKIDKQKLWELNNKEKKKRVKKINKGDSGACEKIISMLLESQETG